MTNLSEIHSIQPGARRSFFPERCFDLIQRYGSKLRSVHGRVVQHRGTRHNDSSTFTRR